MEEKIKIDHELLGRCRKAAVRISDNVMSSIAGRTTTSVERTVARLLGIDGVDEQGIPLPNVLVEQLKTHGKLEDGIFYWLVNSMIETGKSPREIALAVGKGEYVITDSRQYSDDEIRRTAGPLLEERISLFDESIEQRKELHSKYPAGITPLLYVIVATGNIYEDTVSGEGCRKAGGGYNCSYPYNGPEPS